MKRWLRYLWNNEDGFFGIGEGPSQQESQQFGNIAGIGNFATSTGEGDIGVASNFWKSILSGDPNAISKVLGPEISGINKRGQQEKMTLSQFGNRGGGTNATAATIDDTSRSAVDTMTSNLTGQAAGALGSLGSGLLSTGLSADTSAFSAAQTIQQQKEAKLNDIFSSIAEVAGSIVGGFAGGGGGGASLGQFLSPGQISSAYGGPGTVPTTTSTLPDTLG
jgi:hypothetical protein